MTDLITAEEAEKLAEDCLLAAKVLADTHTFPTGQAVLTETARTVTAIHAQLADAQAAQAMVRFWKHMAETHNDRATALAAANAVLEAKVAGLRDFVDDFAKAKIDALRYSPPYGSSPEDDPDPVVDAETVWAWQADAKAALATQEAGT